MINSLFILLGWSMTNASVSAAFIAGPPKPLASYQTNHKPLFSKRNAQDQSSYNDTTPWPSVTKAVTPAITAASIFALTVTSHPLPSNAGDITKGSQIFTSTCAGCHAGGNNFIKEKKTLKKEALEKYVSLDEVKIGEFFKKSFVHQNQAGGGKMSEEEVVDVISYVVSQAVNDKW